MRWEKSCQEYMEEKGDQLNLHWKSGCDWQKGQEKSGLWKIGLRVVFLNLDCTLGSPEQS